MLPSVAIIGRPNVGKSTLFNRLIGRRRALVEKSPGATRDRLYGEVTWCGVTFRAIDTGGWDGSTASLAQAIRAQTLAAVAEADLLVCCCDLRDGPTPLDAEIVGMARRANRPILVAVNKVDTERHVDAATAFAELGIDWFPISAEHGRRVDALLDAVVERLPRVGTPSPEAAEPLQVAILGRPNVGKSSLVNWLAKAPRVIAHELPGTTRDTVDVALTIGGAPYLLVDTAGIRRRARTARGIETLSVVAALRAAERAHALLLLVDAAEGMTHHDRELVAELAARARPLVIAANKWDRVVPRAQSSRLAAMQRGLGEWRDLPILPISARTGYRCGEPFRELRDVAAAAARRIPTAELNRILAAVQQQHHLPSRGRRPMRFYYATQIATRPPVFTIFTSAPEAVGATYQRYLRRAFATTLGHPGVPIRLRFRARRP